MNRSKVDPSGIFTYVVTEVGAPLSLDPLDADNTRNLLVARMIYTTPVEINSTGSLSSRVLESFDYDPNSKQLNWIVKDGVKFHDGAPITSFDVVLAVLRMAKARPKFPVVEDIEGLQDWIAKGNFKSLPRGIKIDGKNISIRFTKAQDHPLFRFTLEIFSIIPSKCVDLINGAVTCSEIPGSGHYSIQEKADNSILFKIVESPTIHGKPVPSKIQFRYLTSDATVAELSNFNDFTIISGNESKFNPSEMDGFSKKMTMRHSPASRITFLLLNPNFEAFQSKNCRRVFSDAFRMAFTQVRLDSKAQASLFTEILPGYLSNTDLENSAPISPDFRKDCISKFSASHLPWAEVKGESDPILKSVVSKTIETLGMRQSPPLLLSNRSEEFKAFTDGNVAFMTAGTGFWALDPGGDVQMLLTPNMHPVLNFVSSDPNLQSLVRNLSSDAKKSDSFSKLNRYLFEDALLNVFAHSRRFFASNSKNLIAELPLSITAPSPWQVFRVDK